jgi:uncharacterized lipoprotein YmbA
MRITRPVAALLAAGALSGCVPFKRTPEARFFTLRPVAERPATAAPDDPGATVGVLPVSLPGFLERPQLVAWSAPGEVRIDEFVRWAEPLDASAQRVLADDLAKLLPSDDVIRAPWPISMTPRSRVRVELARFGPQRGGEVSLSGRFVVLSGKSERALVSRDVELRRDPGQGDSGRVVEAMSALLGDLAAQIANAIGTLPIEAGEKVIGAPAQERSKTDP